MGKPRQACVGPSNGGTVKGELVTGKRSGDRQWMVKQKHILGPIVFSLEFEAVPDIILSRR